ncbi:MAG: P22 phage major capsid protein family protein [Nitrosopumilus sp.]
MLIKFNNPFVLAYANDLDAFVPEVWAQESLMVLEANMVAANLVHRNFENLIAKQGDVVNTRQPGRFVAKKKIDTENVTDQDATAVNVPVTLDQHLHTTFIIKDGEESKGFKVLRDEYLVPALWSIAQSVDQIVLGELYNFVAAGNVSGRLGTANTKADLIAVRTNMNSRKVPLGPRHLIITPQQEGAFLNIADFTTADKIGDDGSVMREGSMGRRFGFNIFMAQNSPSVSQSDITAQGAKINNAGGYAAGATTLTVDDETAGVAFVVGGWITIAGDMTPQMVIAQTGGTTPTEVVITPGLANAVPDDADIIMMDDAVINEGDDYAVGWHKEMIIDGMTAGPFVGQMASYGVTADLLVTHGIQDGASTTLVQLNRPTELLLANNDLLHLGPPGEYGFAFHPNAIALVSRPLALPDPGSGARAAVVNFNGLSIRIVITYDGIAQGHRVTADLLCGVKTLDTDLGEVLVGG